MTTKTPLPWQSRAVFISSTFKDMHAERDHLRDKVFPELEERLKERRCHLGPVDLRMGVETVSIVDEHAKEIQVLKVCLAEIERSRPFLIVLLGDRYGWVAPRERVEAAARQAGFDSGFTGKSVTALEIEFGVLQRKTQERPRCFFYFREPLPYSKMSPAVAEAYSDAYLPDPAVRAMQGSLQTLKAQIAGDPELGPRIRHYRVTWDDTQQKVSGLEEFGKLVLEDLWAELNEETQAFVQKAAPSWEGQERDALEQFIERQGRNFFGREDIARHELLPLACSPAAEKALWGTCVTGEPGLGKSALFAHLVRELTHQDLLLLAHAAGISGRASQVDAMLRRWIGELAEFLGLTFPLTETFSSEEVEETFADLLSRASLRQRVVVMIDGLNQFSPTPRARYLTWLPKLWPRNARLIVTTVPGTESQAFSQRRGVDARALRPINLSEAEAIARSVCRRHHRELNREVLQLLLSKCLPDGTPATGNPLWLELALEQLNLLDADDFARADREYTGSAEKRLHQLVLDVAGKLPPGVQGLYAEMLERAEKVFGADWARPFASLTVLSRFGWREADLRNLLPKARQLLFPGVTPEDWTALRFASLRRGFRAHLVGRGADQQWDFSHAQMRVAVHQRNLNDPTLCRQLHAAIADHLESLPREDRLRQTELMYHYAKSEDTKRASRYYGSDLLETEESAATLVLAETILESMPEEPHRGLAWVISLLRQEALEESALRRICQRFTSRLVDRLSGDVTLDTRIVLLEESRKVLGALHRQALEKDEFDWDLMANNARLGDLYLKRGTVPRAMECYQGAYCEIEKLLQRRPDDPEGLYEMSVSLRKWGGLNSQLGEPRTAVEYYEKALELAKPLHPMVPLAPEIAQHLATVYLSRGDAFVQLGEPEKAAVDYQKAAEVSQGFRSSSLHWKFARTLGASYNKLGTLYLGHLRDVAQACEYHKKALEILEELYRQAPDSAQLVWDLAVGYNNAGDLYSAGGITRGQAREYYQKSLDIMEELCRKVPDNSEHALGLAMANERIGILCVETRELEGAFQYYEKAAQIREQVSRESPASPIPARHLAEGAERLGDLYLESGELAKAVMNYQKALEIRERLHQQTPDSAELARACAVNSSKLGDSCLRVGRTAEALGYYQKALEIRELWHQRAPESPLFAKDLVVSHFEIAQFHQGYGNRDEAIKHWHFCRSLLWDMQVKGMALDAFLRKLNEFIVMRA